MSDVALDSLYPARPAPTSTPPALVAPRPLALAQAALGVGLAGALAGAASGDAVEGFRVAAAAAVVAPAIATPTLLVGHVFANLNADPRLLGAAVADSFLQVGTLAFGLAPMLLFFALTTPAAPTLALAAFTVGGGALLVRLGWRLMVIERAATSAAHKGNLTAIGQAELVADGLVLAWCGLVIALSARFVWMLLAPSLLT